MRATGIIRRIDDLGRIVLPKEIRKSLKIREGDMLEIYVQDNGAIILEKYEPMDNLIKIADKYVEAISDVTGFTVCATTDSYVVSASGTGKKDYLRKDLSKKAQDILQNRKSWTSKANSIIDILGNDEKTKYTSQVIMPIIDDGDLIGSLIVFSLDSKNRIDDNDIKIIEMAVSLLTKQLE